jgi:hypothetical protein
VTAPCAASLITGTSRPPAPRGSYLTLVIDQLHGTGHRCTDSHAQLFDAVHQSGKSGATVTVIGTGGAGDPFVLAVLATAVEPPGCGGGSRLR